MGYRLRYNDGPRDRWSVYRAPLPSAEAWPVVWVWSSLLSLRQEARRRRNIAAASEDLLQLRRNQWDGRPHPQRHLCAKVED